MRVLLLPKYGNMAASSRYRFAQYLPYLALEGIHCTVSPLLSDDYLKRKFASGRSPVHAVISGFVGRALSILGAGEYDLVVIHYELFPFLPPWFEQYLTSRGVRYVVDIDDAIFHSYDQNRSGVVRRVFKDKMSTVLSGASLVLAGSEYLASFARRYNSNVVNLPTVIDIDRYPATPNAERVGPFTIGWVGSPSSAEYLPAIAPGLREFCRLHDAQVVLVGSGDIKLEGIPVVVSPWSESSEVSLIKGFDVGIMPLPDTPWARGKCAFKLIQYMACARPVVASPVGMNIEVVDGRGTGILARTEGEWVDALTRLYNDPDLSRQMGRAGRSSVERCYCIQVTGPRLPKLLTDAAAR